ncbi:MAG: CoA pyrophosphatase [Desulfurococcales archaeon]|nr:CoA pyrophosphatase [Desulfurococcales archaeon]
MREAAVLVLLWGNPPRVLLVRKNCRAESYWSCDIALPGGHIEDGESVEETALREAWEEAWIHPRYVGVVGRLEPEKTLRGDVLIHPVLAVPRGPLCPMPASDEIDAVFLQPLSILARGEEEIRHPKRGVVVTGYRVAGGVLWGATLRILKRLYASLQDLKIL